MVYFEIKPSVEACIVKKKKKTIEIDIKHKFPIFLLIIKIFFLVIALLFI